MFSLARILLSILLLCSTALAVFKDDAYETDWHIPLIGPSLPASTFFHRPSFDSKATLIYTLTERSILAAINPKDGELVWRQSLAEPGNGGVAVPGEGVVAAGAGGNIGLFDAANGKLVWANEFSESVKDVKITPDRHAVVLFENGIVRKLANPSGDVAWEWKGGDGEAAHSLVLAESSVSVVSLQSSKIVLTPLSLASGQPESSSVTVSASSIDHNSVHNLGNVLVWTESGLSTVKLLPLESKASATSVSVPKEVKDVKVHAVKDVAVVHFLSADSSRVEVYTVNAQKGTVTKAYSLETKPGANSAISATVTGDHVFITWTLGTGETYIYSAECSDVLTEYPAVTIRHGITSALSEVVPRIDGKTYALRTFVSTSAPGFRGNSYMVRNGEVAWTRNESLASVSASCWVDLLDPVTEEIAGDLEVETHQSIGAAYGHRVKRHIHELVAYGPAWAKALPGRISAQLLPKAKEEPTGKWRDFFGFRKYILVVTKEGGLAALDAGRKGEIVWETSLVAADGTFGGVSSIHEVRKGVVGIVGNTDYMEFDAFEGTALTTKSIPGRVRSVAIVNVENGETAMMAVLEDDTVVGLSNQDDAASVLESLHVAVQKPNEIKGVLHGAGTTWRFVPPSGETITSAITRPRHDPVASIGRVLGDRSVMYKYINPHLLTITTANEVLSTASVYILDSVSGAVLHSAIHQGVDTSTPITATMSENWLVYSFFGDDDVVPGAAKGYHLVVSELYESPHKNDHGTLGSAQNRSSLQVGNDHPHVISQSYIIPTAITSLAVSSTLQGITSREVLVITPSYDLITIPKRLLDPRRPVGRDPDAAEREEGLFRYQPVLDFDPRTKLNHERLLMGLKSIETSPSQLESTSLIFAYGGDLFGTRVAPSLAFDMLGKGFNKIQMVGTVIALFVGVRFLGPMVRRKQINARWQAT